MTFFEKITGNYDPSERKLIESIMDQLNILFSNRNDPYWAYDVKNKKTCAIHEIFLLDYLSPEFAHKLARAIEIFDPRVFNVKIKVIKKNLEINIIINGKYIFNNSQNSLPKLEFNIAI
jgi:hypothetical protein